MALPPFDADRSTFEIWQLRDDPRFTDQFRRLLAWIEQEVARHAAFSQLTDYVDATDLAHDVAIRALRDPRLLADAFDDRGTGSFRAYLRRFIDSVLYDTIRNRGALKRGSDRTISSTASPTSTDDEIATPSRDPTPSQESIASELDAHMLAQLDGRARELYHLRVHAGLSFADIASRLGITESAARSLYHRSTKEPSESG